MDANLVARRPALKPRPLSRRLLAWWDENRRELPWRTASGARPDPYRVWLSEILLQQTTGAAAAPYFLRFVARWPDVTALAAASLDQVIETFAGLGYYARARNLHACAQEIARRGGRFPETEEGLRALPGVGAYTAGAIAAIAFGRQAAAVDGNVARIIARLQALETPLIAARSEIAAIAQTLVPADRPGDFAEALMDLGAMICRPRSPLCGQCPLSPGCAAAQAGEAEAYPRRAPKKARPVRHGAAYFAFRRDGAFLARRRPPKGLLGATLELPGPPWRMAEAGGGDHAPPFAADWRRIAGEVEQVFTHFTLRLTIHVAAIDAGPVDVAELFWVSAEEAPRAGFSSAMLKAIAHARKTGGAKPSQ
jgi:A/G-specific adenine glycosylase